MLALLAVTVDESDEAFANVYSTAVSLQNVAAAGIAAAADRRERRGRDRRRARAQPLRLRRRSSSCSARSSCRCSASCSPTGCSRAAHYTRDTIFDGPAFRPEMIFAWLVGFGLYQWLSPQGPAWWTRLVGHTDPGADRLHRLAAELRRRVRPGPAARGLLVARRPARRLSPTLRSYALRHMNSRRDPGRRHRPRRRAARDRRAWRAAHTRRPAAAHDAGIDAPHPPRVRAPALRSRSRRSCIPVGIWLFVTGRNDDLAAPCPQRKNWMWPLF